MSLHKDIILGEIAGKNAAVHAYDKILWMIRTGYLTLFYGAWAIVLKGIIDDGGDYIQYKETMIFMFSITFSLAIGACVVDNNYVRRKFRVIFALNKLLKYSFDIKDEESINEEIMTKLHEYLKVSGEKNDSYKSDGYKQAVLAERLIFGVSILPLILALLYIFVV